MLSMSGQLDITKLVSAAEATVPPTLSIDSCNFLA